MKVKFWTCGNCGHEEPITDNDLQELNPVVSSAGAIKISCPNCGAYTISKPFDSSCMGWVVPGGTPTYPKGGEAVAGKKINAFNEFCKDTMIANMADTLKAYGGFPELEKQVYDLKACTVMEVASAVPIVQNVVISAVVKTAVEQAKAQEKEQEQRNGILGSFTKTLCN